ncbi:hypothetical protein [Serratia oryzae]|uniref:Uncharacterized protein n=1 Tax=Serratia oryzae TaxID=2034155 RepID=A0A1S8CNF0_9GAMM|nr:hypothetical protein [Serratia oryzae]OMQ26896.1 hypothetical protein BMI79_00780 [Serratia oryzae]
MSDFGENDVFEEENDINEDCEDGCGEELVPEDSDASEGSLDEEGDFDEEDDLDEEGDEDFVPDYGYESDDDNFDAAYDDIVKFNENN